MLSEKNKKRSRLIPILIILLGVILSQSSSAQFYDLEIKVRDTIGYSNGQGMISIYMKNWTDTVAAYELWLLIENPDVMRFITQVETVQDSIYWKCLEWDGPNCIDSLNVTDSIYLGGNDYDWITVEEYQVNAGSVDITGTLSEDWPIVLARSMGNQGHDLKITAVANSISPPYMPGIGYPQTGEFPLINIPVQINDLEYMGDELATHIIILADNLDNFCFSDEKGYSIGVNTDTVTIESCFHCLNWIGEECLFWERVSCDSTELVDSIWCCDTVLEASLDTSLVNINTGVLTVLEGVFCGDINGDLTINLLDITGLLGCLYYNAEPPCDLSMMDVNCTGTANLLDITFLISYLYKGGPPPSCEYCNE